MAKQFTALSPDGFDIVPGRTYKSEEKAKEAIREWSGGYERQGYYSTFVGSQRVHIPLHEIEHHCTIVPVKS